MYIPYTIKLKTARYLEFQCNLLINILMTSKLKQYILKRVKNLDIKILARKCFVTPTIKYRHKNIVKY